MVGAELLANRLTSRSRPVRKVLVPAILVGFLSACSFAPRHVRPELPTADVYPETYAGDTTRGARAPALGWRDFFADPRLEALIKTALRHNRDLAIVMAQIDEARGLYRIQRAERLPTLVVNADGTRTRVGPESAALSGGGTVSSGGEVTFDRYSLGVGLASFELDFWGRVRNLSAAGLAEYLGTIEAARSFRLSLIREVALAYLASLEAGERLALAEATVQSRREGLRIAQRRLDAGVTSALDFRQAQTLLTQAKRSLRRCSSRGLKTTIC